MKMIKNNNQPSISKASPKGIVLMAVSLFLLSCGNTPNETTKEQPQTVVTPVEEEHQHEAETAAIELNKGEKWAVDAPMLEHIRNMEKDVATFSQSPQKDYKVLATKLQTNVDLLTSNCTMTGQAHDELHKWLVPYLDLVSNLSEAKSETEATKRVDTIKSSFVAFNTYFK